jgi:KUP system potassium uptake protein
MAMPSSTVASGPAGDADLDHKNYYIAHETIVRRDAFLNRIASRAPDFFKISHDAIIEVGFRVEI